MSVLRARERGQPVDLEEARRVDRARQRPDRRVEPLAVADHHEPAAAPPRSVDRVGLVERRGQRLLDQHVDAGLEQRLGDLPVDTRSARRRSPPRTRPTSSRGVARTASQPYSAAIARARSDVAVDHGDEPHPGHRGVEPRVVPPEMPDTDDPDLQRPVVHALRPRSAADTALARADELDEVAHLLDVAQLAPRPASSASSSRSFERNSSA